MSDISQELPDPRSEAHSGETALSGEDALSGDTVPPGDAPPSLEPMVGLEWSQAIELPLAIGDAATPAELRMAWVHRGPLSQVLSLYRAICRSDEHVPSPWWLRAVSEGRLESRDAGFRVEDRVHKLLSRRPGWEFVPWAGEGESGYWEFMPSEGTGDDRRIPTTVVNTPRHTGWIDVLPAHAVTTPEPIAIDGLAGLRSRLGEIEAVR